VSPLLRVLIVADDLTGAADCGAACAAHGLDTVVVIDDSRGVPNADALAFDTNSRCMDHPEHAAAETARIVRSYPASLVYKKIDSTLRGHVATEIAAALDAFRNMGHSEAVAVVAPAFPAMGRTTKGGRQYVRETLVEDCDLTGLLDAETDDDLRAIVAEWTGREVLWVGSAGLMSALMQGLERRERRAPKAEGPILFAVGSLSERSRDQVEALREAGVENELILVGESGALANEIARRREPIGGLVLTGGDTARAVLRALGIAALRVVGEVETGVPILVAEGSRLPVVTKAGDFGDRETLVKCRSALKSGRRR
jgi:uncharacterized protein YgbK (DUF1537 family)